VEHRFVALASHNDSVVVTSLPLLGQQLSTIMAHGIARAGGKATMPRWTVTRKPGIRLVALADPVAREGDQPAVAMLTFDGDAAPPLLIDAFEAALFDGAETEIPVPALLRHGFDAKLRPVEAAFGAIRRLVAAGVLRRGGAQ
jgi:hypothetical protein